jgi:ssDNA-binding Zn-finger/Zn-ribbon topoisomerase 1
MIDMKKWMIIGTAVSLMLLFGCQNDQKEVQSTKVEEKTKAKEDNSKEKAESVFTKKDRQIAKEKAEKFIVLLTEFHGRSIYPNDRYKAVYEELTKKAREQKLIHPDTQFINLEYNTTFVERTKEDSKLILRRDRFQLGDNFREIYYTYLDVHELNLPISYISVKGVKHDSVIRFVKTTDGEIYILDAPMLEGMDLETKDEDAYYDEHNRKEIEQEVKEELNIQ